MRRKMLISETFNGKHRTVWRFVLQYNVVYLRFAEFETQTFKKVLCVL